jgi:putative redox protein
MTTRAVTFAGASGARLAARLELPPDDEPRATALFAHCFTCSKDLRAAVAITRELAGAGFAVLRFDFTGLGESEGDFADTDFTSNVDDLVAAARWLEEEIEPPAVLVGHSLGGAAVLRATSQLSSVKAVATIGAPADPAHVLQHVSEHADEIRERGEATVTLAGRPFTIRASFLDDVESAMAAEHLAELGAALLVMHSPVDRTVGVENARRIYDAARHPKSFLSLDTADHLLTRPEDARYAARVLGAWAARYVPQIESADDTADIVAHDRVVTRTGPSGFRTDVMAGRHRLVADEPASVGGSDEGPTPYDLLVAGLGACTSMTLRMYADRKEWPLEEVRVRLRHSKIHRTDEEACVDGREARLDRVHREIELVGALDDEQRTRLIEIADRCPVHRTLERGIVVETDQRS